jgi:hypothetical protein
MTTDLLVTKDFSGLDFLSAPSEALGIAGFSAKER